MIQRIESLKPKKLQIEALREREVVASCLVVVEKMPGLKHAFGPQTPYEPALSFLTIWLRTAHHCNLFQGLTQVVAVVS